MKKRILITRRLPEAAEARAHRDYAVVQHADDHQMTAFGILSVMVMSSASTLAAPATISSAVI